MKKIFSIVFIIVSINFSLYSQEKSREIVNTGEEEELSNKRTILDDSTYNVYNAKSIDFIVLFNVYGLTIFLN